LDKFKNEPDYNYREAFVRCQVGKEIWAGMLKGKAKGIGKNKGLSNWVL